jgi:hypothetical protein
VGQGRRERARLECERGARGRFDEGYIDVESMYGTRLWENAPGRLMQRVPDAWKAICKEEEEEEEKEEEKQKRRRKAKGKKKSAP